GSSRLCRRTCFRPATSQGPDRQNFEGARMSVSGLIRRYWPETLLIVLVTLPWLSLLALGLVWLWQGGRVAIWALAAAALGRLACGIRYLALLARSSQSAAGARPGDQRNDGGAHAWRALLSTAGIRDATADSGNRTCCHRPLFGPPHALRGRDAGSAAERSCH